MFHCLGGKHSIEVLHDIDFKFVHSETTHLVFSLFVVFFRVQSDVPARSLNLLVMTVFDDQ